MKKQKKYRKPRSKNNITPIVIGVGLMLIGIVLFVALQGASKSSASSTADRSVVPMSVNYPVPSLSLQNINGKTEALEDFRGKVLMVNNWATWCPPCKAEMPSIEKYYEAHAADGFVVVAIEAGQGMDEVTKFANDFNLKFHVWLDPNGGSLNAFKNGNLPNSYVIDRTGTVRYAWTGEISLAMLEKIVTPLIAE